MIVENSLWESWKLESPKILYVCYLIYETGYTILLPYRSERERIVRSSSTIIPVITGAWRALLETFVRREARRATRASRYEKPAGCVCRQSKTKQKKPTKKKEKTQKATLVKTGRPRRDIPPLGISVKR